VAAELKKDDAVEVETRTGGIGEFTVLLDGAEVLSAGRFLDYPRARAVLDKVYARMRRKEASR
jgi:hypothetical protein